MAKYYYNGILLPELPKSKDRYWVIAYVSSWGSYGAYYTEYPLYRIIGTTFTAIQNGFFVGHKLNASQDSFEEFFTGSVGGSSNATFEDIVWSNYDILDGSATSTTVFLAGSDPVPEGGQEPDAPNRASGYLIRSGSTLYTIIDGTLTALAETEITASLFQTYGVDDLPDGALLVGLTDPEVLYWQDSTVELPDITLTVKGTPPLPQMFTSEPMSLVHESIAGISHAAVDASEDVRFAISFDGGTTWKAHDGSAWFDTSDTVPGMLPSTMNAITAEQWAEVVVLNSYMVRFWLPNVTAYVASVVMHYINP